MRTLIVTVSCLLLSTQAWAISDAGSFSPTSFKIPIESVVLNNAAGNADTIIYSCAPSGAKDCVVDLADAAAVASLFTNIEADLLPGMTYTKIGFSSCPPNSPPGACTNNSAKVKGTVMINGTAYYTTSGTNPLTTDSSKLDYATIVNPSGTFGAGGALPKAITPMNGDMIELNAFFSLRSLAKAAINQPTTGGPLMGACTDRSQSTSLVCTSYGIDLVAYQGAVAPTLEDYLLSPSVSDATQASLDIQLLVDGNGKPFGGFFRDYLTASSVLFFGYSADPTIHTIDWGGGAFLFPIADNGVVADAGVDGYLLKTPGSSSDSCGFQFANFELATHTGTLSACLPFGDMGILMDPYLATKQ
jgi:hypothetical protein